MKKIFIYIFLSLLLITTAFGSNEYKNFEGQIGIENYSLLSENIYEKVITLGNLFINKYSTYNDLYKENKINILLSKLSLLKLERQLTPIQVEIIDLLGYKMSSSIYSGDISMIDKILEDSTGEQAIIQTASICNEDSVGKKKLNDMTKVCTEIITERTKYSFWKVANGLYCNEGNLKVCNAVFKYSSHRNNCTEYCGNSDNRNDMLLLEQNWTGGTYEPVNRSYNVCNEDKLHSQSLNSRYENLGSCEIKDLVEYEWEIQCSSLSSSQGGPITTVRKNGGVPVVSSSFHIEGKGNEAICVPNTKPCNLSNGIGAMFWSGDDFGTCMPTSCDNGFYKKGSHCATTFIWETTSAGSCSTTCGEGTMPLNVFCKNLKNNTTVLDDNCNYTTGFVMKKPSNSRICANFTTCEGPIGECRMEHNYGDTFIAYSIEGEYTKAECLYKCEQEYNSKFTALDYVNFLSCNLNNVQIEYYGGIK